MNAIILYEDNIACIEQFKKEHTKGDKYFYKTTSSETYEQLIQTVNYISFVVLDITVYIKR